MQKVDEGERLDLSDDVDDEEDESDVEGSGDSIDRESIDGDIKDVDDEGDDVNPLLVNPDEETDQTTKSKLWFSKVCKKLKKKLKRLRSSRVHSRSCTFLSVTDHKCP